MSTVPGTANPGQPTFLTADGAAETLEARLRAALAPNLLLVREIGAGGMARVFLAREPALKRLVAVKVLAGELASTEAGRARFEREAQAVAQLSHPNIVSVHTVGELADGTPYFIMQYVDGRSMAERIDRDGPLSLAEARRALGEVAAALAAAHAQGIVHRDVKPANILSEDATGRVLVSDFGIAAVGREAAPVNVKLTATGAIIGTPQYMSPEQLLAEPVTEKTDVYSLGLLAHELLCGSAPFKGTTPHELIAAHLRDVPARLSQRRPDVDPELDAVVAACLAKSAADRPTADEVARRLVPGAGALLEWPPPGLDDLQGRLRRLATMYLLGGAALTFILLAIVAAGPAMRSALASPLTLLLLVGAAAAAIALGVAVARTVRTTRLVTQAVRGGYAWMTVLETLSDTRGDTGNLVAASREYAGLEGAERDRLRLRRVWRELALLLGGVLALPTFVLIVVLGSGGVMGWAGAWIAAVPPLAGLVVALWLGASERRHFAARRARRRPASDDVGRLAAVWYETFETVRRGQRIGRGRAGYASAGRWGAAAAVSLLALLVLLLLPVTIVGTVGAALWRAPQFGNTQEKVRIARLVRGYVLPRDSSITPLAAGEAFAILQGNSSRPDEYFRERPVPVTLPPVAWSEPMPDGVFPTARFDQVPNLTSPLTIIGVVRRGVSPDEMAYLGRIAGMPHWRYYDVLARAPAMDYVGARFALPFPAGASATALPIPRFAATKALAYASVTRAAYFLARNQRDSAEHVLRGTISFGFLLVEEGSTLIEQLIGAVMVGIGRTGLVEYYKAVGDPRGSRIQAQMDSVIAAYDAQQATRAAAGGTGGDAGLFENVDGRDAAALRGALRRTALNADEMRGVRMEMLFLLGLSPCTNVRELVFGMDADARDTFAKARAALTRHASDAAVLDLLEHQPESATAWLRSRSPKPIERVALLVGGVLRNDRLAGCVTLLSSLHP